MNIRLKSNLKPDLMVADVLRATDGTVEAARFNLEQKGFFYFSSITNILLAHFNSDTAFICLTV